MSGHRMNLEVHQLFKDEVYLDIVRIPEEHRIDRYSRPIEEGRVCRLTCDAKNAEEVYVIARGLDRSEQWICLDEKIRNKLHVECGKTYHFEMSQADFCGQVWWALDASDVRFSFPARVSLISGALGILSVILGLVALKSC